MRCISGRPSELSIPAAEAENELVTFRTRREFKEKWTITSSAIMKGQIAEHTYASPHSESTYGARLNKMFDILQLPFPR